jgi:hypothetical protein
MQTIDSSTDRKDSGITLSLGQPNLSKAPKTLTTSFIALCPHCRAKGDPAMPERLNEWGPVIARSDGKSFHLIAADSPLFYPTAGRSSRSELASVGFWYVHEGNGPSTETVVVLLPHPPRHPVSMLRLVEIVADRLAELLTKTSHLPCLYEFDGSRLIKKGY